MTQSSIVESTQSDAHPGPGSWMKRHPLIAYFSLAFIGSWILILPLLLSRGFRWFDLPDAAGFGLFILSTYTGPFLAAVVLSRVTGGSQSVKRLFKRVVQVRVGLAWYLLVFIGYPLYTLAASSLALGRNTFDFFWPNASLILSVYLPSILINLFMPGLGEETGWRGFALPRLQLSYGPLPGSLILGALHALWHLPVYFIPGMMTQGGFDPVVFVANSLAIMGLTLVWTWLFNHAKGSIFFAIYAHSASNANSSFLGQVLATQPGLPSLPWLGAAMYVALALLLVLVTRGKLSYRPDRAPEL